MNKVIRDYQSGTNSTRLNTDPVPEQIPAQHATGDAGTGTGSDAMPNRPQNMNEAIREIVELRAILAKARK